MPAGDVLKKVVEVFRNDLDFPLCAGVIDGTHIPIISPEEYPSDYYNCKGFHSIIMQGMVDNRGHFTEILRRCTLGGQEEYTMRECL